MIIKFLAAMFSVFYMGLALGQMGATITERVERAHQRIEHGIQSGSLTREEAHRLRIEFTRVRDDEYRARADGHLDRRERERLHYRLDRLERHISYLKHNDQVRGDGRGYGRGEGRRY